MSTEALNRIIKEVNALTPQERCELIERLTHGEQNSQEQIVRKPGTLKGTVKSMAPDFDLCALKLEHPRRGGYGWFCDITEVVE